ncbi:alpha-L-rhamnosidase C-terminal domain-containing protein [Paenibacillus sp. GCM10027626]|uniref:alpha-L-rhamnosidase-related protein n=1 Tax=Paenibacillus sp. GCM10027626 TaxID=3273411 RepID=UPI003626E88B
MEQQKNWQARWIWKQRETVTSTEGRHELVYFRRRFEVPEGELARLVVDVSADSRYRLFLNGHSVSVGPCKGDRFTHHYETVDLSPYLRTGANVLAVKVLHFTVSEPFKMGAGGPASIWRANSGAFFFEGSLCDGWGQVLDCLNSDTKWSYFEEQGLSFVPGELETLYVGGVEHMEGALHPHGWAEVAFDDTVWSPAAEISAAYDPTYGQLSPWPLAPRPIPPLYEVERGFRKVMRSEGFGAEQPTFHLLSSGRPYTVPAGGKVMIELDAGELTTGYLQLAVSGGQGGVVKLLSSECYEDAPESAIRRNKGRRDDVSKGYLLGDEDTYIAAGIGDLEGPEGGLERYEPFWFRTFRFVRLTAEAGGEPLVIHSLSFRETGYPLETAAEFRCSDETMHELWDISVRTLKRCMHETYEDCPFYEQLQYAMDTRLQILFTYHLSADDRLARKAIFDFHSSMLPNGMLQSRYPSTFPQIIPGFSVYWIMMIHDHYRYFADLGLVRRYLPTVDAVLGWFEQQVEAASGLVGPMPLGYWPFVDWVEDWRASAGVPTAGEHGPLTISSLQYMRALQVAAELNDAAGRASTAAEYRERADAVGQAIRRHCWSEPRQLFRDGPSAEYYSQHVQIWAVLSQVAAGDAARRLIVQMLEDRSMPQVSYAMAFFLFRALSETKLYAHAFPLWDIWRELAACNLTTWVEDPVSQRSDCHGWGAAPLYEFPAEILGITPAEPGFARIQVAPNLGGLTWAEGKVAIPQGIVQVRWELLEEHGFRIFVDAPRGIPVSLLLPNGKERMLPEAVAYELAVKLQAADGVIS